MDEDLSRPGPLPRRDATRPDDYVRGGDGSWGVLPILLGVAFIVLLGFLIFGPGFGPTTDRAVTSQRNELPNTAPSVPPVQLRGHQRHSKGIGSRSPFRPRYGGGLLAQGERMCELRSVALASTLNLSHLADDLVTSGLCVADNRGSLCFQA